MQDERSAAPAQAAADDERFMREALIEARRAAELGEVPIGAVVVCEGQVIARAHNRRELDEDPSAHAEFSALLAAARHLGRWRLFGCTVYVTLEPCVMCAGLMVNARIDRCVYGAPDPKGGALGTLYTLQDDARLNHVFAVTPGVLQDACAQELRAFFGKVRAQRSSEQGEVEQERAQAAAARRELREARVQLSAPRAPRVLLAIDSFKGSATSAQAAVWAAEGVHRACPAAQVQCLSVADGGEGTLDAVAAAIAAEVRTVRVRGPLGTPVDARFLLAGEPKPLAASAAADGPASAEDPAPVKPSFALIEMAEAAGLGYTSRDRRDALAATTWGVGELMLAAVAQGARRLYLALGGSATTDGGAGMLQALGARVLDADGHAVAPGLAGLAVASRVDIGPALQALAGVELTVLSDVDNPLVGARGAVRVFGPQKGLDEAGLDAYDGWMLAYARALDAARQAAGIGAFRSLPAVPGAGAAGGMAAALLALGAQLVPGIDAVLDLVGFDDQACKVDLVITGEGSVDAQSAAGKTPVGVARRAKRVNPGVRVVALCGARADELDRVYDAGIDAVVPVLRRPMALEQALEASQTHRNLACAAETVARLVL